MIKKLCQFYQADPRKRIEERVIDGIKFIEIPKHIVEFPDGRKIVHPAFINQGEEEDSIFISEE